MKLLALTLPLCVHTSTAFRCVQYVDNYDGDTITFNIPNVHPLLGQRVSIRLVGIDTPEMRTNNVCEKMAGIAAKRKVANLLRQAKRIDLENVQRGKYFRIVADVKIDGQSLTESLLNRGVGYPYDGGKKKKINWCGDKTMLRANKKT